ncbi:MAG TPA: type IV secretion system DNA-binding domain-containing protein [Candidatus Methylacidiphilales bacterium]|nr:type IV secretion system DNA-binding domain-containing protein [Candidatus Methylacidiphilales bacterium]
MNIPDHRWKATPAGLVVPEYFDVVEDRLDETVLRLPCYEPSGTSLDFTFRDLLRHLLICGQTGSGKTTVLNRVWSDLISYRGAKGQRVGLLILDSQGDHTATNIRRLAAEAGRADDVRVLSPQEGHFNPLGELTSFPSIDAVASKIVSATRFAGHTASDRDAYWTENTRALIEAALTYLLIQKEGIDMIEAFRFMADLFLQPEATFVAKQLIDRSDKIVTATRGLSPGIMAKIEFAQRTVRSWAKLDSRTRSIIQSCLMITLSPFLATTSLPYWDSAKGSLIDPTEALDGKIVVICTRAATEVETASMICRLVKMDFYGRAQARRTLGESNVTGLVMDEFHYAATKGSPRWSDISNLATLRSKGVFVIAATQGLVQLDLLLGPVATEALLINFSNLILMRSVEIGHLYALAERVFGYRPGRIVPGQPVDSGQLVQPGPMTVIPPEPICPPGALAQLETHQAYVSLANGYKSLEPIWLAPLFLEEPTADSPGMADMDIASLRRAQTGITAGAKSPVAKATYYSVTLWEFLLNAVPRQVQSIGRMTMEEFRRSLQGLGRNPNGLETIPPAWRIACFNLARRLPSTIQLRQLSAATSGTLEVILLSASMTDNISTLVQLEDRWRHSVYPTPLRPLHRRDRQWIEQNYPHLCNEIHEAKRPNEP